MPILKWVKRSTFLNSQYLTRENKKYAQQMLDDLESNWNVRYAQKGTDSLIELTPLFNHRASMYNGTVWRLWVETPSITFMRQLKELQDVAGEEDWGEELPF